MSFWILVWQNQLNGEGHWYYGVWIEQKQYPQVVLYTNKSQIGKKNCKKNGYLKKCVDDVLERFGSNNRDCPSEKHISEIEHISEIW